MVRKGKKVHCIRKKAGQKAYHIKAKKKKASIHNGSAWLSETKTGSMLFVKGQSWL